MVSAAVLVYEPAYAATKSQYRLRGRVVQNLVLRPVHVNSVIGLVRTNLAPPGSGPQNIGNSAATTGIQSSGSYIWKFDPTTNEFPGTKFFPYLSSILFHHLTAEFPVSGLIAPYPVPVYFYYAYGSIYLSGKPNLSFTGHTKVHLYLEA
ncbi:hypothetical protein BKA70DRAFT_1224709 [Coprinopsis sp. MPI-PUGE-AT-0042]|nr:hypothetical protein BKA70DRAFT_1224709 [Coprinopsis sp. MPI-PUGE-AT-0042]